MGIEALNSLVSLIDDVVDLILGKELPSAVEQVVGQYLLYFLQ